MIRQALVMCTILLLVATDGSAQTWRFPLRAGWSNGSTRGHNHLGSDSVNGFAGSVGAALRLNDDFGVEFDIAYAQKGAKGTISDKVANSPANPPLPPSTTIVGEVDLDYLELWVMADAYLGVADNAEVVGYLGLSLGNLINAKAAGTINGSPFDRDIKDATTSVDFAGLFGAGFAYELERVTLKVDFIAEIGFADINDTIDAGRVNTNAFYTMLGVDFGANRE